MVYASKKDLSCFSERGCSNLSMASVFLIFDVTPFSDSLCPNQFTSVMKNSHFDSLRDLKFLYLALLRHLLLVFRVLPLNLLKLSKYHLENRRCFLNCSVCDPLLFEIPLTYQPNNRIRSKIDMCPLPFPLIY